MRSRLAFRALLVAGPLVAVPGASLALLACAAPPPPPSIASAPAPSAAPAAAATAPSSAPAALPGPDPAPAVVDAGATVDALTSTPTPTLQQRATACLLDPVCPAAEADRLFRAAADAREDDVDCFRFTDGDGTAKDLPRARACLDRGTASGKCDGSSADLGQAELAFYLIDGVGGPQDIPGARKLFDGCFADVTQQEVLAYADARAANPAAPRGDFCKDYGGTTLTGNSCSARARQHEETRGALLAKRAASTLDDEGKRLFAAASSAYASYVQAMGSYVYEVYKDGSIRNAEALGEEQSLLARRTASVARLGTFVAGATPPQEIERGGKRLEAALKKSLAGAATRDVRARIADAQSAWTAYRDAEVALYVHAFGGATSADAVRGAVEVRLSKERVADLQK